jgi:hypothetical protein
MTGFADRVWADRKKETSLRTRLAAAAGGLVLAVALGGPTAAQAGVNTSGPATATAATPDVTIACSAPLYDVGNQKYGAESTNGLHGLLFFSRALQSFCVRNYGGGKFNIYEQTSGDCLSVDTAHHIVGWESACGNDWDKWEPMAVVTAADEKAWEFKNVLNNQCMYDDAQEPAVYTVRGCSSSDIYQQFTLGGLPL